MAANNCLAPPPHICAQDCVFLLAFPPNDPESANALQTCLQTTPLNVLENRLNQYRNFHNGPQHVVRGILNDNIAWEMFGFMGMTAIVQELLDRIHYLTHNEVRLGPQQHNFFEFDPINLHNQLDEFDLHVFEEADSDGSAVDDVIPTPPVDDIPPPPPNPNPLPVIIPQPPVDNIPPPPVDNIPPPPPNPNPLPVIIPPPPPPNPNPLPVIIPQPPIDNIPPPPPNPLPVIIPEPPVDNIPPPQPNPPPVIIPEPPVDNIPPPQPNPLPVIIGVKRSWYEVEYLEPVHKKKRRASI